MNIDLSGPAGLRDSRRKQDHVIADETPSEPQRFCDSAGCVPADETDHPMRSSWKRFDQQVELSVIKDLALARAIDLHN